MVASIVFTLIIIGFFVLFLFLDGGIPDHIRAKKSAAAAKSKRAKDEVIEKAPEKALEEDRDDQSGKEERKCPGYGIGTSDCFCCTWNGTGRPPCY